MLKNGRSVGRLTAIFAPDPVDPPEWTGWVAKLTFRKGKPVDLQPQAVLLDPASIGKRIWAAVAS